MRKTAAAGLSPEQQRAAESGMKGMMPIGRPFLDYILSAVADAGYRRVCVVIGPEHETVRSYYAAQQMRRLEISFAVQREALGTANAVAAAERFVGRDFFLALNSDNYYPAQACMALRELSGPGVVGFAQEELVRLGNIPLERIKRFAILREGADGFLERVEEKPAVARGEWVSMNCWMLPPAIFAACGAIGKSARGEYELPDAVNALVERGEHFRMVPMRAGVLDLSSREDVAEVARRLAGREVAL